MNEADKEFYNAVVFGSPEEIKALFAQHPDLIHKTDDYGQMALHWIMTDDRPEVAELLIASGADVHASDDNGMTPLHLAQGISMVKVLIRHGANVDAKDKGGGTPLHHWATEDADTGAIEAMDALLKAGANPNLKDRQGKTPLDYALQREEDEKVALLRTHSATTMRVGLVPFRHVIESVIVLLVGRDYDAAAELTNGRRLRSEEMANAIRTYGKTLVLPPQDAYDAVDAVAVRNADSPQWSVRMPLWTKEEERSDLILELTVTQIEDKYSVKVDDIHVL